MAVSEPSERPPTVEEALTLLSLRTTNEEPGGLNPYDAAFGHTLAEKVGLGIPLTGKQRRAAWRMLRKYSSQLRQNWGLDYDQIPVPLEDQPAPDQAEARAPKDVVRVTVENDRISVRSPYRYKDVCRSVVAGRWNAAKKCWTYPASPTSALSIRNAFMGATLNSDDAFTDLVRQGEEKVSASAFKHVDAGDLPAADWSSVVRTHPWEHQQRAMLWAARLLDIDISSVVHDEDEDE